MTEKMKVEAGEPGGFSLEPPISAGSVSELKKTQDDKDLSECMDRSKVILGASKQKIKRGSYRNDYISKYLGSYYTMRRNTTIGRSKHQDVEINQSDASNKHQSFIILMIISN